MKKSSIILVIGLIILAVGAGLSIAKIEPWADYVLIAGAVVVLGGVAWLILRKKK